MALADIDRRRLQRANFDGFPLRRFEYRGPFGSVNHITDQLATRSINIITASFTDSDRVLVLHQGFLEAVNT